jgi:cardiolipin synthase
VGWYGEITAEAMRSPRRPKPTWIAANPRYKPAAADRLLGNDGPEVYADSTSSWGQDKVNLPNLITLARILSVPLVVWAITSGEMLIAFVLFVAAGISDAVDGFLAKRFDMTSELGAYLDPLADKVLIVSIYVALGISEAVPRWLVILVVSRDLMIIGAVMLSWLVGKPVEVKPLLVSKLNTAAQIFFAGLVLGSLGLQFDPGWVLPFSMALVAALTLLSVAAYVREWVRHMGSELG